MKIFKAFILMGFVFILLGSAPVFAAAARGIVAGDPAEGTVILRDGQEIPCQSGVLLYEDDIIQGNDVAGLPIEWHPYSSGISLGETQLKVVFNPPNSLDLGMQKFKEFFGFVDGEIQAQYAATRGDTPVAGPIYPLPGFSASLLPGQSVSFIWGDKNLGKMIVEDKNKAIVWQTTVSDAPVEATPESLGMTSQSEYTWRVEGLHDKYKLRLLDEATAQRIIANLAEIDRQYPKDTERKIMKALYLQFVSENSRGKIDLYWLGDQFLKTADPGADNKEKAQIKHLHERMVSHLDSER